MSMHFDLVDLRLIVRVAEFSSLTKGAEHSNISLAAASTRIKNLEESIGAKLFYRSSQGVTLTPSGHTFVQHAHIVLGQIENMRGDMQEYAKGIKGHLRIFANTTALCEFLPPVLGRYLQTHPDINIDLRERMSHDIVHAITEGHTDIGIVAGTVNTEKLEVIPYRNDRLVLVVARTHALAKRADIDFEKTLDLVHVGLNETSALHGFLRQMCDRMHRQLHMRIQVGNFEAACRMIEAHVGVGIMPESAARRHTQTMDIQSVPLTDPWAFRANLVCVRSLDALPSFARDLVALLADDAKSTAKSTVV